MAGRSKEEPSNEGVEERLLHEFGRNVREARKRAGLTLQQLGSVSGLVSSYIFEIETRGGNLSFKALINLAAALNVSIKDLVPDNGREALSPAGVGGLIASLDRVTAALEATDRGVGEALEGFRKQIAGVAEDVNRYSTVREHVVRLDLAEKKQA